jgi:hypothetical protein
MLDKGIALRFTSKIFSYSGLILIFLSLIALLYGVNIIINHNVPFFELFTASRVQSLSIPVTLGIALLSIGFALSSDEKMVENSNVLFLQAATDFVDARSIFISGFMEITYNFNQGNLTANQYNDFSNKHLQSCLWRSNAYLKRASELTLININISNQKKFYGDFHDTLWQIFDQFKFRWKNIDQKNRDFIIDMYSIVRNFDKSKKAEEKIIDIFEKYMGKYHIESEQNYYGRLIFNRK